MGLLLAALRNRASAQQVSADSELGEKVDRAREAWREALLQRGILPFLRDALADPDTAVPRRSTAPGPSGRMPPPGFDRPGVGNPGSGPAAKPSPSFSSPDFGGPEGSESDASPE
ncbi:hypothetical protein GCM10010423_70090 [Streptomyces levis]|uniref:Uncharacterized protein n=1 Tax=Streptomyces levis TaxID=285566 RepID=A0ABP6BD22_9ACTN